MDRQPDGDWIEVRPNKKRRQHSGSSSDTVISNPVVPVTTSFTVIFVSLPHGHKITDLSRIKVSETGEKLCRESILKI